MAISCNGGTNMSIDHSQGPLTGIRVVDMSVMISGPLAGMTLADQGAEVIKVESPGLGDMMRYLGSQKNGITGIYALHNRGKKSLVVDLKKPEGTEVLRSLVATADVLIQNFRPGAVERLGFGRVCLNCRFWRRWPQQQSSRVRQRHSGGFWSCFCTNRPSNWQASNFQASHL